MDPKVAEQLRSRARRALKGHWLTLLPVTGLWLLTGMAFMGLTSRPIWFKLLSLILTLAHPLTDYGRARCFALRLRGRDGGFAELLHVELLPRLLGIRALRDGLPLILIVSGNALRAADAANLAGQALPAAGLLAGVALYFNYCMAEYLLVDRPALGPVAALRESRRRLSGRRMQLFTLALGFVGWILLAALAFCVFYVAVYTATAAVLMGVGFLLLTPLLSYVGMTKIAFFEAICRRRTRKPPTRANN